MLIVLTRPGPGIRTCVGAFDVLLGQPGQAPGAKQTRCDIKGADTGHFRKHSAAVTITLTNQRPVFRSRVLY